MNEEIPRIRTVRPQVPVSLESVAMRALERAPEERFQSAGEMGAALRNYLLKTGEAAGTAEISAFINGALGERAQNKKSMLERLRTSDKKEVDVTMLNPESSESMPSRSHIEELPTPTDPAKAAPKLPPPPIEELFTPHPEAAPEPVRRKKLPTAFWGALAGLLVGLAVVLVWAMSQDISSSKKKIQPASAPEKVVAKPTPPPEPPPPAERVAPEPAPEPGVSQPSSQSEGEPAKPAEEPKYGFLRVDTVPWSEVYLGRRRLGITPINRRKLKAGKFRLTFINKDEGIRQTLTVKIRPGKITKVVRNLKP
jgi:serine/threonine-protein kinase